MQPQNFRESVFTLEELDLLKKIVTNGNVKQLTDIYCNKFPTLMTPEKEIEISKLKNFYEPQLAGFENKVNQIMEELEIKEHLKIETPEQEAAIQMLKNRELKFVKQKNSLLQKKTELEGLLSENKENSVETKNVLKDVIATLKEMEEEDVINKTMVKDILKPKKHKLKEIPSISELEQSGEKVEIPQNVELSEPIKQELKNTKKLLQEELVKLGIKIDGRWKEEKLAKLLKKTLAIKEEDILEQLPNPVLNSIEENKELNQ